MKSIKEASVAYGREHNGTINIEDFEAGANYVLSVLNDAAYKEDWITNPKDGIRRFYEICRQLKK